MLRENDRKDCGKETYEEIEDIKLGIDMSQVMIDGKTITIVIVDLLQVQNLVLT